jgi:hypothetical protein
MRAQMVRKPNTDVSDNGGIRSVQSACDATQTPDESEDTGSACGGAQTPDQPEDRVFHADAVPYIQARKDTLNMADCCIEGKEMENYGIITEARVPPILAKQSPASFMRLQNRWGSLRSPPTYTAVGARRAVPDQESENKNRETR